MTAEWAGFERARPRRAIQRKARKGAEDLRKVIFCCICGRCMGSGMCSWFLRSSAGGIEGELMDVFLWASQRAALVIFLWSLVARGIPIVMRAQRVGLGLVITNKISTLGQTSRRWSRNQGPALLIIQYSANTHRLESSHVCWTRHEPNIRTLPSQASTNGVDGFELPLWTLLHSFAGDRGSGSDW